MPKKENKTEEKKVEFLEFDSEFKGIKLTGRIYPTRDAGKKIERNSMTLNVNGLLSITCEFVETSNNYFVSMPQYKSGDKYKSWVFVAKDTDMADALEDLSYKLFELKKKF